MQPQPGGRVPANTGQCEDIMTRGMEWTPVCHAIENLRPARHEPRVHEEPEEDEDDEEDDHEDLVLRDAAQLASPLGDHLLDPGLAVRGAGVGAEAESLDDEDDQPGQHGVEQHQRHREPHPGGVAEGVAAAPRPVVTLQSAQHHQVGRSTCQVSKGLSELEQEGTSPPRRQLESSIAIFFSVSTQLIKVRTYCTTPSTVQKIIVKFP